MPNPMWKPVVDSGSSRTVERLGHRPAAARRPERRRVRVQAGDRSRAGLCRRLAERGARADPGRRDRRAPSRSLRRRSSSTRALGRIHFFKALIEKADGDYDARWPRCGRAAAMYPRDRVVLNQIARILFLKREYQEAIEVLEASAASRPRRRADALHAMLAYRGSASEERQHAKRSCSGDSRPTNLAGDHRQAAAC